VDQLVTDLQLLACIATEAKAFLTTATKKEFLKKLNAEVRRI
jgi:hypothetical protein